MNQKIDISGVQLRTARLILRPWRQMDLADFYEYASVDGVGQMAGWLPHENMEVTKTILDSFIAHKKTFAIEYEGKIIGSLGIESYNEANFPELDQLHGCAIGYVLSKSYWGRGVMPEAVKAVMHYLFDTVGIDFILISYFEWNRQSARVIQKCGLNYLKTTIHETHFGTKETTIDNIIFREGLDRNAQL